MPRTARQIPEWYTEDWSPATARNEMSAMRWEDLEDAIDLLIPNTDKGLVPKLLIRTLWLDGRQLSPMQLLQRLLLTLAGGMDPARPSIIMAVNGAVPAKATGALPRWSYTDLEVALSYTWSGLGLQIATARHHDFLAYRDDRLTGTATARQLILLVCGLPSSAGPRTRTTARP